LWSPCVKSNWQTARKSSPQNYGSSSFNASAGIEDFGRGHDSQENQHSRRLLNLERDTAELMCMPLLCSQRKRVLEIGTSNGYSAIYLASTLREIRGSSSLVTIEKDSTKALMAKQNFERANLDASIDLRVGSASEIVKELTGPFDCVFFDADRVSAPEQLQLLLPNLTDDVLLLADNVLSHPGEIEGYIRMFDGLPDFWTSVVRIGKRITRRLSFTRFQQIALESLFFAFIRVHSRSLFRSPRLELRESSPGARLRCNYDS
jgi:predicted O-methyltransferase YrrM